MLVMIMILPSFIHFFSNASSLNDISAVITECWIDGCTGPPGAYVWIYWKKDNNYNFDVDLEVTDAPEIDAHTLFWTHQFSFVNGSGGYIGLQVVGSQKKAIFSIWGAITGEPGNSFEENGSGWQIIIDYDWKLNRRYRLRIWKMEVEENGDEWWLASVYDYTSGSDTVIGKILVPSSWGWLTSPSVTWIEYAGYDNYDPEDIPYTRAVFSNHFARNNVENATPDKLYVCYGPKPNPHSDVDYYGGTTYALEAGDDVIRDTPEGWLTELKRTVGVKGGDWALYNTSAIWSSTDPSEPKPEIIKSLETIEWINSTVQGVSGAYVSVHSTWHLKNGTEQIYDFGYDIAENNILEEIPLLLLWPAMIFPANLSSGEHFNFLGFDATVNGTTVRTYANACREINYLMGTSETEIWKPSGAETLNLALAYYWDKRTGVICEVSLNETAYHDSYAENTAISFVMTKTNIWQPSIAHVSLKIPNIFSPLQVNPNKEFHVSVTVSYTFPSDAKINVTIWNYTSNERLAVITDVVSGCDFKIYDFKLESPPSTGMLELLINASYLEEGVWKQEEVGGEHLLRIPVVEGEVAYSSFMVTNSFFNISYNGKWYKAFMIYNMTWQDSPDYNDVEAFYKWRFSHENWLVLNSSGDLVDNVDDYAKVAFAAQTALWGICEYENVIDKGNLFKELSGYAIAAETCRMIGSIAAGMAGGIVLGYVTPSFTVKFFAQSLVNGIKEGVTDPGELITRMAIGGLISGSNDLYTATHDIKPVYDEYMTKYYPYTVKGVHVDYKSMMQYYTHMKNGFVVGFSSMHTLSKIYEEGIGSYLKSIAQSLVDSALSGATVGELVAYAEKLITETPELKGFLEDLAKEESRYNIMNSTFFETTKQIASSLKSGKTQIAVLSTKTTTGKEVNLLVSSNSTILSKYLLTAEKSVSIKVEGSTGTKGNLQISIPKSFLESESTINQILVTVDGKEVPFTTTETAEAYVLNVNYAHSEHTILIYYLTYPVMVKVASIINQPLINAKVTLSGANGLELTNYTNNDGYAVFNKVPTGDFIIKAEYKGITEAKIASIQGTKEINLTIAAFDVFGTPLRTLHAILLFIVIITLITIVTIAMKKRKAKK